MLTSNQINDAISNVINRAGYLYKGNVFSCVLADERINVTEWRSFDADLDWGEIPFAWHETSNMMECDPFYDPGRNPDCGGTRTLSDVANWLEA